jgi:hypothetical protein
LNLFEIKNKVNQVKTKAESDITNFVNFTKYANEEIHFYTRKISDMTTTSLLFQFKDKMSHENLIKLAAELVDDENRLNIINYNLENYKTYSKFNNIVYAKLFYRLYKRFKQRHSQLRNELVENLAQVKVLTEQIKSSKQQFRLFQELNILNKIHIKTLEAHSLNLVEYDFKIHIDSLFNNRLSTITKNEMLNLLSLNKTHSVQEYINQLPGQIDIKTFYESVFVEIVESENDRVFADMMLDSILLKRNKDNDFAEKIDDKLFETFGLLRTCTVQYDEYLQVVDVKENKPKLKTIKGGMQ